MAADSTGTIAGKVYDAKTGMFLSSARVSVGGTNVSAVTNTDGSYRLTGVPAGDIRLTVEYGGTTRQSVDVAVSEGLIVRQNVGLRLRGSDLELEEEEVYELKPFEVTGLSEFNAQVMANSEERYSMKLKDVIATDQFGDNTDGNLGEFIKFLPGLQVNYGGGAYDNGADATSVGVRGFSPDQTKIMVDGVEISGSTPGSMSRAVGLDMISVNNASRIEVTKLPTADMPDGAVGGSINLISRTAFEYPRAQFDWRVYLSANSENLSTDHFFGKTPGPTNKETFKAMPGFDFSYIKPINDKLGITITGQRSEQYNENHSSKAVWGMDRRYQDAEGHYDHVGNPYLSRIDITDAPRVSTRTGMGLKLDWRPAEGHNVSFRFDRSEFEGNDSNRRIQVSPDRPLDWGSDGDGTAYVISQENRGKTDMNVDFLDREGSTNNYYLNYKLERGPWKINALASTSRSKSSLESVSNGHFSGIELSTTGIGRMEMNRIADGIPGRLNIVDRDGDPYNLYDIDNYKVNDLEESDDGGSNLLVKSGQTNSKSIKDVYRLDVTRDLDFINSDAIRLSAKAGFYRQVDDTTKTGRGINYVYRYIGPVDAFDPTVYADEVYVEQDPGFGFSPMTWVDPYKIYTFFEQNPNLFTDSEDVKFDGDTVAARNYNEDVQTNKSIKETKDSYYAQLEGRMMNNRLSFVTGMRWSRADRVGYGPFQDKDWKSLKKSDGTAFYYTKEDGSRGTIDVSKSWQDTYDEAVLQQLVDAGFLSSISDNNTPVVDGTLAKKQLEYKKNYRIDEESKSDPMFSFQTAYEITSKLTARVGFSRANGLPDYEGSYGILQKVEFDYSNDGTPGKIKIGNPDLEPWRSKKFDYQLAYYTNLGGKLKVSYFTDETTNYVVTDVFSIDSMSDLAAFNLPLNEEYIGWTVSTQRNGEGVSETQGYEFEVNQSLGFLGDFGQMFNVWGSYSTKSTEKTEDTNLSDSPDDSIGLGLTFRAGRFSGRIAAAYQSEQIRKWTSKDFLTDPTDRNSRRTYPTDHPDYDPEDPDETWKVQLYHRTPAETRVDVNLNYQLTDRYGIFYSARNVTNTQRRTEIFDEEGLLPDYVNMEQIKEFGFNMQLGVRGSF